MGNRFEAAKLSRRTLYIHDIFLSYYYKYNWNEIPCDPSSAVSRNRPPPADHVHRKYIDECKYFIKKLSLDAAPKTLYDIIEV